MLDVSYCSCQVGSLCYNIWKVIAYCQEYESNGGHSLGCWCLQKYMSFCSYQYIMFIPPDACSDMHCHILCAAACPWLWCSVWDMPVDSTRVIVQLVVATHNKLYSLTACNQLTQHLSSACCRSAQAEQIRLSYCTVPQHYDRAAPCVRRAQFWLTACDQVCIKSSEYSSSGFAKKSTVYSPSNRLSMQQALLRRRLKCITNSSSHKECLLKRRRYKRQQTEGQAKEFTVRKARKLLKNAIATVSVTHVWSYFYRENLLERATSHAC